MPTWQSAAHRGSGRARYLLRRAGEELHRLRLAAGLSTRQLAGTVGISHTQIRRIEAGVAPHIDVDLLSRIASALGGELSIGVHPIGPPVRDKAHVALLERFAARLGLNVTWRTEVPIPLPGDLRSADGVATVPPSSPPTADLKPIDAVVEAETRLHDVQATERRLRAKQRDLGTGRAILLIADTRHNRRVISGVPELGRQFPVGTRSCLAALNAGRDPGADCLVIL
ncbi:MAG TPA: helix-turn-helix transcriptional regulator [Candidatus Limnocylindrales bacterium]|nr:helix-turn-helix transcriptional regulator [Candidatus Limnocylindrales bacterium]